MLERLENDLLLVGGDANPRVADGEGDDSAGAVQRHVVGTPTLFRQRHVQRHLAALGKLERIGEQVLKNLL